VWAPKDYVQQAWSARISNINRFYSHVSITAKPLFAHFTFNEVKQQQVSIRGQVLTNYVMEKIAD